MCTSISGSKAPLPDRVTGGSVRSGREVSAETWWGAVMRSPPPQLPGVSRGQVGVLDFLTHGH